MNIPQKQVFHRCKCNTGGLWWMDGVKGNVTTQTRKTTTRVFFNSEQGEVVRVAHICSRTVCQLSVSISLTSGNKMEWYNSDISQANLTICDAAKCESRIVSLLEGNACVCVYICNQILQRIRHKQLPGGNNGDSSDVLRDQNPIGWAQRWLL